MQEFDSALKFDVPGGIKEICPYGGGNIQKTFLLTSNKGQKFILQNLNTYVFKSPDKLMDNGLRITRHLQKKVNEGKIDWQVLNFTVRKEVPEYLYRDELDRYWRMFSYIPHSSINPGIELVHRKAGEAYGKFISLLSDLPGSPLFETIPHFHDLIYRLEQFEYTRLEGIKERIKKSSYEIKQFLNYMEKAMRIPLLLKEGKLPVRIAHHDTKIDNILFNERKEVVSVIDLDTVMPGIVHSDFGDAIRSFGSTVKEDEKDVSKVSVNLKIFSEFSGGFLSSLEDKLTNIEKQSLLYAPSFFAYMQALRFFNDYLLGDPYYKTAYEEHNLVRTRNQLALFESMIRSEEEMEGILMSILGY